MRYYITLKIFKYAQIKIKIFLKLNNNIYYLFGILIKLKHVEERTDSLRFRGTKNILKTDL